MSDAAVMSQRLAAFLSAEDSTFAGCEVADYQPIVGGISRMMARFTVKCDGRVEQFVLRADPPGGGAILETDRGAEWALIRHLVDTGGLSLPAARYFDRDGSALGTPAIIMEAIEGTSLVSAARAVDLAGQCGLGLQLADLVATVHQASVTDLPNHLARPSSWDTYLDGRIAEWAAVERSHKAPDPFMRYVGAWLDTHRPPAAPLTLVHGDFQIANVMVDGGGALSLVDWELGHIGDPREDLGWFRLVGATTPPDLIGVDEASFLARYRELTGLSDEIVNPGTVAYFTILGSAQVFSGILGQAALLAEGKVRSTAIAYTVLVQSFIHGVWLGALSALG